MGPFIKRLSLGTCLDEVLQVSSTATPGIFADEADSMTILHADANDFAALSLLDLLRARDMFHVHLMNKANVIGTAVGRYLIRRDDPYPSKSPKESAVISKKTTTVPKGPKILSETEVRYYSWPCVLVLVDKWLTPDQFGTKKYSNEEFVPPTIYLPDGRSVPVCVVEAPLTDPVAVAPGDMSFPSNLMGGGYPVVAHVQGETHIASIGCMVTDVLRGKCLGKLRRSSTATRQSEDSNTSPIF
jgi:hypothetical protein